MSENLHVNKQPVVSVVNHQLEPVTDCRIGMEEELTVRYTVLPHQ